jgi:hypothetical protein
MSEVQAKREGSESGEPEKKRRISCDYPGCEKSFLRSEHLSRHQLNHYGRTLECDQCGKKFARRYVVCVPLNLLMIPAVTFSIAISIVIASKHRKYTTRMASVEHHLQLGPSPLPMEATIAQLDPYQPMTFLGQWSKITHRVSCPKTIMSQISKYNPSSPHPIMGPTAWECNNAYLQCRWFQA